MKLSSKARYGLKACLALAENYNENQPLALPVFAEKAGVSANIITRLKRDQYVAMESIEKICHALNCGVDDILDFTK